MWCIGWYNKGKIALFGIIHKNPFTSSNSPPQFTAFQNNSIPQNYWKVLFHMKDLA
jgi:hypothetical protein